MWKHPNKVATDNSKEEALEKTDNLIPRSPTSALQKMNFGYLSFAVGGDLLWQT